MALTFDYKVRDRSGNLVEGELEADSVGLVAGRLREMGYLPVSITARTNTGLKKEIGIPGITDRVKLKEIAVATRQLATMIDSGLSIVRALAILSDQIESAPLARAFNEVRAAVEQGSSLSDALEQHPKIFNTLYVTMIKAGEIGGNVDTVLRGLADTLERQAELTHKIRHAMIYPVIVISVMMVIFAALLIFIVPIFKKIFTELHAPLPVPTKIVLAISHTLLSIWILLVIAVIVGAVIAWLRWINTEQGRAFWDRVKLRIPIFGPLMHKVALARFASSFASLLSSGVPILETLDIVSQTANNATIGTALQGAKEGVRQGQPLAEILGSYEVIPSLVIQMMDIGEKTGALDSMLQKVADFYNEEVEVTVNSLTTILEPVLTVCMGVVVGTIVVSMYMPMFTYVKYVDTPQNGALLLPLRALAHLPLPTLLRGMLH